MGIVGLLISRGVRFMADGLNGPTNEEARELLEIRLEEAQAQHAEDLEKIGREMAEVVAQRDAAREERDHERAAQSEAFAAWEIERAELSSRESGLLRVQSGLRYDRDAAIARAEKAEADVDTLNALIDTERAELAAIRAATGEEPTDNELASASFAAGISTDGVFDLDASRRAVYNLGRTAAQGEVARMREEVATLRARVAELEAAPQGHPVATDEELCEVFDAAWRARPRGARPGILAVAARVRAERPACLVARAVALGCDVSVATYATTTRGIVWSLEVWDNERSVMFERYEIPAADVPATLARLLDEVEANRKADAERVAAGRKGGA